MNMLLATAPARFVSFRSRCFFVTFEVLLERSVLPHDDWRLGVVAVLLHHPPRFRHAQSAAAAARAPEVSAVVGQSQLGRRMWHGVGQQRYWDALKERRA